MAERRRRRHPGGAGPARRRDAAVAIGDPGLAAELAQRALDDGAGVAATLLLARAETARNHFEEADALLAGVEGELPDQATAAAWLDRRCTLLYWQLWRHDELLALMDRAATWWSDEAWAERLAGLEVYRVLARDGIGSTPDEVGHTLADPALAPEVRRRLEPLHAAQLFYQGRAREGRAITFAARPEVPLSDALEEAMMFSLTNVMTLDAGIGWAEHRAWLLSVFPTAVRSRDHIAAGLAGIAYGHMMLSEGRLDDAARWLGEAETHFEQRDVLGQLMITRALQGTVAAVRGDTAAAAAALERAVAGLEGEPLPFQKPFLPVAQAWIARAEHDLPHAQELLTTAAPTLEMPIQAAWLWYEAFRAGAAPQSLLAPLAELAEQCDAPMVDAYDAHVRAAAGHDGAALLEVSESLEAIGPVRFALEAAADAANAFVAAGREDSARRAAVRARELFSRGQGGELPEIDGLEADAVALTRREQQIVALVREGLTNGEIAERLVLSVRTVETHLYRAMQKRGVSDRHDLLLAPPRAGFRGASTSRDRRRAVELRTQLFQVVATFVGAAGLRRHLRHQDLCLPPQTRDRSSFGGCHSTPSDELLAALGADAIHVEVGHAVLHRASVHGQRVVMGEWLHVRGDRHEARRAALDQRSGNFRELHVEADHRSASHSRKGDRLEPVTGDERLPLGAEQMGFAVHAGERAVRIDEVGAVRHAVTADLGRADHDPLADSGCSRSERADLRTVDGGREGGEVLELVSAEEELGEHDQVRLGLGDRLRGAREVRGDIARRRRELAERSSHRPPRAIPRTVSEMSSKTMFAAATAVTPDGSYAGATSTTSALTGRRSYSARPRRIASSSRDVRPPGSGVPVPGAKAGSSESMSTEI